MRNHLTHTHTHTCMYVHMYIYVYLFDGFSCVYIIHVCIYIYVYMCVRTCVHVYTCIYIYVCVYMHVCIHTHTHFHPNTRMYHWLNYYCLLCPRAVFAQINGLVQDRAITERKIQDLNIMSSFSTIGHLM